MTFAAIAQEQSDLIQKVDGGVTPTSPLHIVTLNSKEAVRLVVEHHYLHRRCSVGYAFGLVSENQIVGVSIFGTPASRQLQKRVCPTNPSAVMEFNRFWVSDEMPRNTETWFIARSLSRLPSKIIISFADTAQQHMGVLYRAANFRYAGWTEMERRTPRPLYVTPDGGQHQRHIVGLATTTKVARQPKVKYWTTTGTTKERKKLVAICGWPSLSWKDLPPPTEHTRHIIKMPNHPLSK